MNETKSLLASKTVWAGIATILSGVVMVIQGFIANPDDMTIVGNGVFTIFTGLGVIYGRERATTLIK